MSSELSGYGRADHSRSAVVVRTRVSLLPSLRRAESDVVGQERSVNLDTQSSLAGDVY